MNAHMNQGIIHAVAAGNDRLILIESYLSKLGFSVNHYELALDLRSMEKGGQLSIEVRSRPVGRIGQDYGGNWIISLSESEKAKMRKR